VTRSLWFPDGSPATKGQWREVRRSNQRKSKPLGDEPQTESRKQGADAALDPAPERSGSRSYFPRTAQLGPSWAKFFYGLVLGIVDAFEGIEEKVVKGFGSGHGFFSRRQRFRPFHTEIDEFRAHQRTNVEGSTNHACLGPSYRLCHRKPEFKRRELSRKVAVGQPLNQENIMNRRTVLASAAFAAAIPALLSVPAFAQGAPAPGDAEKKHAADTKKVGSLSLATSRVAEEKASDPMVKAFAKWEVAEQETIADIFKSMESTGKAEGALKPPSADEVEAMLDPEGKTSLEKLRGLSGAEFDKAYVAAQLDDHKKLAAIQEDYLKVGQNREHLSVTKLARGQIKEHIEHLDMLKSKLG